MKTVPEMLREAADLHEAREKEYGNASEQPGEWIALLLKDVAPKTGHDWSRFAALFFILMKVGRYVKRFHHGGHDDSMKDISVYATMLRKRDMETPDDGGIKLPPEVMDAFKQWLSFQQVEEEHIPCICPAGSPAHLPACRWHKIEQASRRDYSSDVTLPDAIVVHDKAFCEICDDKDACLKAGRCIVHDVALPNDPGEAPPTCICGHLRGVHRYQAEMEGDIPTGWHHECNAQACGCRHFNINTKKETGIA